MNSTAAVDRFRAVPGKTERQRLAPLPFMGSLSVSHLTAHGRVAATLCDVKVAATGKSCYAHASFYDEIVKQNQCGRHKSRNAKPGTGPSWSDDAPSTISTDGGEIGVPIAITRCPETGDARTVELHDLNGADLVALLEDLANFELRCERAIAERRVDLLEAIAARQYAGAA